MRILFGRSFKRYKARTTAYRFRRSTATKFTDVNTVTVSNKTTAKTISKLYGGKRYYVRCRTCTKRRAIKTYSPLGAAQKSSMTGAI